MPESLPGRKNWTGLKTLGMVIRTRNQREGNGRSAILHQQFTTKGEMVCSMWCAAISTENTRHWTLDMTFREEQRRTGTTRRREPVLACRFALGLLKQHPDDKISLVMKRRGCGWNTDFLTEVLFGVKG